MLGAAGPAWDTEQVSTLPDPDPSSPETAAARSDSNDRLAGVERWLASPIRLALLASGAVSVATAATSFGEIELFRAFSDTTSQRDLVLKQAALWTAWALLTPLLVHLALWFARVLRPWPLTLIAHLPVAAAVASLFLMGENALTEWVQGPGRTARILERVERIEEWMERNGGNPYGSPYGSPGGRGRRDESREEGRPGERSQDRPEGRQDDRRGGRGTDVESAPEDAPAPPPAEGAGRGSTATDPIGVNGSPSTAPATMAAAAAQQQGPGTRREDGGERRDRRGERAPNDPGGERSDRGRRGGDPEWRGRRGLPSGPPLGFVTGDPVRDFKARWSVRVPRYALAYFALMGLGLGIRSFLIGRVRDREAHALEIRAGQLESALTEAKLSVLQGQIHPHFLFNALHSVGGLIRMERGPQALTALASIGDLLRSSLEATGEQLVALDRELDLVERYLEVESLRLGDRLGLEIDVPSELMEAEVPAFVVQPLVENAIKHAIAPRPEGGSLRVAASAHGASLWIDVVDDGPGYDPDAPHGVGLANVRSRLESLFDGTAALEIGSLPEGGTRARLVLPLDDLDAVSGGTLEP